MTSSSCRLDGEETIAWIMDGKNRVVTVIRARLLEGRGVVV